MNADLSQSVVQNAGCAGVATEKPPSERLTGWLRVSTLAPSISAPRENILVVSYELSVR